MTVSFPPPPPVAPPDAPAALPESNGRSPAAIPAAPVRPLLVSVVIPALNEAACIQHTIRSIPLDGFHRRGFGVEVLIVDNASEDATRELALAAGARVVTEKTRGYGFAYRRGFLEALGDIICTMDADRTYPAEILPALARKLVREDLDFVSTDRLSLLSNGAMSRRNRLGNRALSGVARALFGLPFRDSQSGMWVFRADLLRRVDLRAGGMGLSEEIKIEAAWRAKARCAEVPIVYRARLGDSKLRVWRDGFGNLAHLIRLRFR